MNTQNENCSRGPLTLKFYGVDDESTTEEEETEQQHHHHEKCISNPINDPIYSLSNGNNNHYLTINHCYGKINTLAEYIYIYLFSIDFVVKIIHLEISSHQFRINIISNNVNVIGHLFQIQM